MKTMQSLRSAATLIAAALLGSMSTASLMAQPRVVPDRPAYPGALFRTLVPTLNSVGNAGPAAPVTPQLAYAATPATFSGPLYTVGPTDDPTTTVPEAEEEIAVDPRNPNNLVAAISDFSIPELIDGTLQQHNTTKYAFSADNGATWQEAFVPYDTNTGLRTTSDGYGWQANSDPVVAIDTLGHVYVVELYFDIVSASDNSPTSNGLYVNVDNSLSDGVQFTTGQTYPVVPANPNGATLEDKPWIAVDNSSSLYNGTVYVSWTHFAQTAVISGSGRRKTTNYVSTVAIMLSRSTDYGVTWQTPVQINPTSQNSVQGSQVAVGPDGTVYVVWNSSSQQFLSKSTDGGQTFSAAVAVSPVFNPLSFTSTYRKNSFPALAVDPSSGALYVAYADQPSTNASRIELVASYDQGAHFTAPVALDDDNALGQRLMPALAVDGTGTVHCSWFDTRNSPDGSAQYYDIYASYSSDQGASFAPNARVTASTINAGTTGFLGDYSGITAAGGFAHPVWTDGSDYHGQENPGGLQTASLILPTAEDFIISATPSVESAAPGSPATYTVAIIGSALFNANNDSVSFTVSGLPADGTASFSPSSLTGSGSSTLTVSSATAASYNLVITATSGSLTHSVTAGWNVENPDFSLAVSPASASVPALSDLSPSWTANYTVNINPLGGFADPVSFSASGVPFGWNAGFAPNPATAATTLSVTVPTSAPAGTTALTLTGTDPSDPALTHSVPASLVVASAPTAMTVNSIVYSASSSRLNLTLTVINNFGNPVANASVSITLDLNGSAYGSSTASTGSNGQVTFQVRNAPSGTYTTVVKSVTASGLTWNGKYQANSLKK